MLVRNGCHPMFAASGTDDSDAEVLYTMQRAAAGGCVLGGTYDVGNWASAPDPNVALRIMARAVAACPDMAAGRGVARLSVVGHNVGLRPHRRGGVRIEAERLDDGGSVVHNYGHAGWGYQGSYGCAERVVELVDEESAAGAPSASTASPSSERRGLRVRWCRHRGKNWTCLGCLCLLRTWYAIGGATYKVHL